MRSGELTEVAVPPAKRVHLRVAWLCGAVLFLEAYDITSVGNAVPSLVDAWKLPPAMFTQALTSGNVGLLLGLLGAGLLGDRHRHEAARQERGGALPDRGRPRGRSSALPGGIGNKGPHRSVRAQCARRDGPLAAPGEVVRAEGRDRHDARGLRPGRDPRYTGTSARIRLFRCRQIL